MHGPKSFCTEHFFFFKEQDKHPKQKKINKQINRGVGKEWPRLPSLESRSYKVSPFYGIKLTFLLERNSAGQQSFDLCVKEESNGVIGSPEGNYSLAAQTRSSLSLLRLILR